MHLSDGLLTVADEKNVYQFDAVNLEAVKNLKISTKFEKILALTPAESGKNEFFVALKDFTSSKIARISLESEEILEIFSVNAPFPSTYKRNKNFFQLKKFGSFLMASIPTRKCQLLVAMKLEEENEKDYEYYDYNNNNNNNEDSGSSRVLEAVQLSRGAAADLSRLEIQNNQLIYLKREFVEGRTFFKQKMVLKGVDELQIENLPKINGRDEQDWCKTQKKNNYIRRNLQVQ